MTQLITQLQSRMPNLHFPGLFPKYPNINPQAAPNAEEEDEDENLGDD